jgi:type II secretory pathway predicted ATPase ExeA
MYETFFGFYRRPFSALPRTDLYFPGEVIEAARQTLARCAERGEGVGLVVGPSGTGKTLLCRLLAEQFQDRLRVVMLAEGRWTTRRAMLQTILYELQQTFRGLDEGEMRLALIDYIMFHQDCRGGVVLVVDEAHRLPLRLLDELRLLTDLSADGEPCCRLVLAGSPVLEERFASPKLESLNQRVVARCYLEPLGQQETRQYIHAQIMAVGGQPDLLFPGETCQAVHRATEGVARLINQLCDHALLLAEHAAAKQIEPSHVEEAWADLQQLPTAAKKSTPVAPEGDHQIIEFGGLDDEPEPATSARPASSARPAPAATLPLLRVTPEDHPSPCAPLEQLHQIEDSIAELDEEFQPAGSIGPEVELVFVEAGNPFSEQFAEEEVVADPLALRARPDQNPDWPAAALTAPPVGESPDPAWPAAGAGSEAHGNWAPPPAIEVHAQPPATAVAAPGETRAEETSAAGNAPLTPVENRREHAAPASPPAAAPVRHDEYRQLFARLRRG